MFYNVLEKILKYGLLTVLVMPLIIGESLIFPLITTKAFFFYILVDILLIAYVLTLRKQARYPHKSKLLYFFLGITVLSFLIDLLGINFKHSFWGNYERMVGIFTSLHILFFIWILLAVYNTKAKFIKLLDTTVIVSFLVSVYGLLQKLGVKFFGIIELTDVRVHSTLGNAAYLAGYLLIHLFLIGYLFTRKKNIYWRVFYGVAFLFDFFILFSTATRGAVVGLGVAVLAMLVYLLIFDKSKRTKVISGVLLLAVLLSIASVFIFKDSALIKSNLALRRISEISLEDNTTNSRLLLWKMSIEAAKERPIFGYGTNNMRIPLDNHHDYNLVEDWFDSSHSKYFDELLTHGVVGLLLYIVFLFWVFVCIFKLRKQDFVLSLFLLGLFVAYAVQSLFIFDSFVVSFLLVFVVAFLLAATTDNGVKISKKLLPGFVVYPLVIIIVLFTTIVYLRSVPPAKYVVSAYRLSTSDLAGAIELIKKADEKLIYGYDIVAPSMAESAMVVFNNPGNYNRQDLEAYAWLLSDIYKKAIVESGNYSKFYINLAKMYQLMDKTLDIGLTDESYSLLEKALQYSPNRIEVYYVIAQGYFNQGKYEAATAKLEEAVALGVRLEKTYLNLAQLHVRQGTVDDFLEVVDRIYDMDKEIDTKLLEEFAQVLVSRQEWQGVLEMFLKIDKARPKNVDTYFNIALAYKKLGDKEKAVEWADRIIELNPFKTDEVNSFILSL